MALNSFEAAYQDVLVAWIDGEIKDHLDGLVSGSALHGENADQVALRYAARVQAIDTLKRVRAQCETIENQLSGQ